MKFMSSRTPDAVVGARYGAGEHGARSEVFVRCPLCDADHYRVRYDSTLIEPIDPQRHYTSTSREFGRFGRIVDCRSCGIVYMNPRPHHLSVQDAYGEVEDVRYVEEEEGRVATFSESLAHIRRYAASGRLLDVGCHVGTFIALAEEAGYDVEGVEPSRWAAKRAGERVRGPVRVGVVEDAPLAEGAYDVVTMWDVIEHLPDPSSTLRAVHAALRPGGVFAVTTMDVEALFPRIAGRRWPWYMQMHLFYFSRRTLGELLRRCGFELVEVSRHRRVVRVSYAVSRLGTYSRTAERVARFVTRPIAGRTVGIDLGDIVTVVARKPER
jgi:2-polyprenyl-3-methyl-5-hydroxy-6-metoxy-1,4-benzoquinol methylase